MRRLSALLPLAGLAAAQLSLDVTNPAQLLSATQQALANLLTFYQPSSAGVFDQASTPWHSSSMMWGMFSDFQAWSGDNQFSSEVVGALVNISYGTQQDVLGGVLADTNSKIYGRWNDDILWPAIAFTGFGELYGANATVPAADGPYVTVPQRTLEEAWGYWTTDTCNGGIYWSRNPEYAGGNYKNSITLLEFVQAATRTYLMNKNQTILNQATQAWDWWTASALYGSSDGTVNDGFNAPACASNLTTSEFTYNYGMGLGAATWLHYVTKQQSYLDTAALILQKSLSLFFTTDSIMELCEQNQNCGRDAQDFKAVYVRMMSYLWRETNSQSVKSAIQNAIDTSVNSMVSRSCATGWWCNGNWTAGSRPVRYVRSQHASAALLVAALGIHTSATGTGLITNVNQAALNATGAGNAGTDTSWLQGSVDSRPLDAAPSIRGATRAVAVVALAALAVGALL